MRNLKRALSLALAAMMLIGMMVVGASAAAKDFTDADEIKHPEAVNTLVTLNVISGKEDGSYYDPTGTLTRAEMAKLVTYVLNGGVEPVLGTKDKPTYSDIDGHWAEAYIEYCTSMNIIVGDGAGKFNPEGTLTAVQCAKMLLTAMDYKDDIFGFVGNSWDINVNREANAAGLYKELGGITASSPISRDDAAQMVYNAIQSQTMELSWSQDMSTGQITQTYKKTGPTLFSSKFNGTAYEGVLVASGETAISGTASEDYFSVQLKKMNGVDLTSPATTGYPALNTVQSFKYAKQDLTDLLGQYVKVLYNNKDKTVYGVYSVVDMNTVVNVTSDKVSDKTSNSIKLDDVKYSTDSSFSYTINNTVADNVKFIDNNGDGKLDLAITTPVAVYKVTYVGTTSFTFSKVAGTYTAENASNKFEDVEAYDGMAKDDIVVVYTNDYTDTMVVEKANVVSGTVSGYNQNNSKYQIDGVWYQKLSGTSIALGNTVDYYAIGGVIYYAKVTNGATDLTNVAMVITTSAAGDTLNAAQAKLLFSDGTKKVVTLSSDTATAKAGDLYTFEINNSGEYKLATLNSFGDYTKLTTLTLNDSSNGTTGTNNVASVNGTAVADDAVIFVFKGTYQTPASSNDGKIITGKEMKSATITACGTTAKAALSTTTSGLTKVAAAAITVAAWPTTTSYANYGYIVAAPYQTTVDGAKYMTYQIWDGANTVTYKVKTDSATPVGVFGQVIGYDIENADTIKNVTLVSTTSTAVKGLVGNEISFTDTVDSLAAGTIGKLDGNTKYLYVNSSAAKAEDVGVTGGSVQLAINPATGIYVKNVLAVANNDKTIKLIVVDVNNQIALQNTEKGNLTITGSIPAGVTITVDGVEYTASASNVVKPGDIVKVTTGDNAISNLKISDTTTSDPSGATLNANSTRTFVADGSALTITIS